MSTFLSPEAMEHSCKILPYIKPHFMPIFFVKYFFNVAAIYFFFGKALVIKYKEGKV